MSIEHLTKKQKTRYWELRVALQTLMLRHGWHFTESEVHSMILNTLAGC